VFPVVQPGKPALPVQPSHSQKPVKMTCFMDAGGKPVFEIDDDTDDEDADMDFSEAVRA
jgi:hypothetical protein